jgi:hypothetical protein
VRKAMGGDCNPTAAEGHGRPARPPMPQRRTGGFPAPGRGGERSARRRGVLGWFWRRLQWQTEAEADRGGGGPVVSGGGAGEQGDGSQG